MPAMDKTAVSVIIFVLVFAAFFATTQAGLGAPDIPMLYHYGGGEEGLNFFPDLLGALSAYFFVFFLSILFFGAAAPLAALLEALKYSSLYFNRGLPPIYLALAVPQVVAIYSASLLSVGISEDYEHKGIVFRDWEAAVGALAVGLFLTAGLFFLGAYVSPPLV